MKMPNLFQKSYTRAEWEKKVLRHVYLPKERDFLNSLLQEEPDGTVHLEIPEESPPETRKRVERLAKEIRANRGVVSFPKVAVLVVILAGIVGSYYFLRNQLVERAMVAALEGIFQAKAEVEGVEFDPFQARVSWKNLTVADKDKPMRNLFELGSSVADLDLAALLRGRVLMEELRIEGIQWNTERKTSGALPQREKEKAAESGTGKTVEQVVRGAESAIQSLTAKGMEALKGIDVEALVKEQVGKLETTRLVVESESRWKEKEQVLRASAQNLTGELEKIGGEVASFRSLDFRTLTKPEEILSTVQKAEALIPRVKQARDTATGLEKEARQGLEDLKLLKKNLEDAVKKDMDYAESLVSLAPSEAASLAELFFASYAKEQLGTWYGYGEKALQIAESLKRRESAEEKPSKALVRRSPGRDIPFPGPKPMPRFTLRQAIVSVGKTPSFSPSFTGELRDLSSHPDLLGKPTLWKARWESPNPGKIDLEGKMDLRKESSTLLEVSGRIEHVPIKIEPKTFGVQSIEGKLRTDLKLMFPKSGGMDGTVQGLLMELKPQVVKERSPTGSGEVASITAPTRVLEDLVQGVLQETKEMDATVSVQVSSTGKTDIVIRSGIDKTVKSALTAYLREEEKRLKVRAREEVRKQLSSYLSKNETFRKGWEELEKSLGGKVTDASAYQKLLEDKKKEAEQRIDDLKKEAAERLLKEAQKIAPPLPKEVPKELPKTPSLPSMPSVPKPPSLPSPKR
ncbi:MAG: TIGR03545 family protein [Spirochaetes bacterium]|nr:TIGR03545 family protein [Spirochaetota bacterium]